MTVHRAIITPTLNSNATPRHNSRGPLYDATYEGKVIVMDSTEPGLDGARALKAMGLSGRLEIWDNHLAYYRFHVDIEKAAGLTVQEGEGRPILRKFKPFAGHKRLDGFSASKGIEIASNQSEPPTESFATIAEQSEVAGSSGLLASPASAPTPTILHCVQTPK